MNADLKALKKESADMREAGLRCMAVDLDVLDGLVDQLEKVQAQATEAYRNGVHDERVRQKEDRSRPKAAPSCEVADVVDERAAFERWLTALHAGFTNTPPNFNMADGSGHMYEDATVSNAWAAWEARAVLAKPVLTDEQVGVVFGVDTSGMGGHASLNRMLPVGTGLYAKPVVNESLTGQTGADEKFPTPPMSMPALPEIKAGIHTIEQLQQILIAYGQRCARKAIAARRAEMGRGAPVAWREFDGEGAYNYFAYEGNEGYADRWDAKNPALRGWVEPLYTAAQPAAPAVADGELLLDDIRKALRTRDLNDFAGNDAELLSSVANVISEDGFVLAARKAIAAQQAGTAVAPVSFHRDDEGLPAKEAYATLVASLDQAGRRQLANWVAHGARAQLSIDGTVLLTRRDWDEIKVIRNTSLPAVPRAWKLVPVEATEEMLNSARDWSVKKYGIGVGNDGAIGCYKAMLDAAPTPPTAPSAEADALVEALADSLAELDQAITDSPAVKSAQLIIRKAINAARAASAKGEA